MNVHHIIRPQFRVVRLLAALHWFRRVLLSATVRYYWDDCFSRAAALAYTTLFSLVPVTALSISVLKAFGLEGGDLAEPIRRTLQQVLPPMENAQLQELQEQVFFHLQNFTSNITALNAISILALCFTSIALLNTIESALNTIWRVSSNLTLFEKIFSFWAVLTLGLPLIIVSIYWTTKVTALAATTSWLNGRHVSIGSSFIAPALVSWIALWMLYYKMPASRVRLWDAALGGLIAALLFEVVKRGFAYYVTVSAGYSKIYGVIATIPLFLFWLYCAWVVVLFGAEIAYQSGSIAMLSGRKKYATDMGEVGALLGLRILHLVGKRFLDGLPPPTESEIVIQTGGDPVLVRTVLDVLTSARILSAEDLETYNRTLLVAPHTLTLGDVMRAFTAKDLAADSTSVLNQDVLIESFRLTALNMGAQRPASSWSLEELIYMGRPRNVSQS